MRISKFITFAGLSVAFSATANAQFSVSSTDGGSAVPSAGTGGDAFAAGDGQASYDTVQAGLQGISTVAVGQAVTSIESIQIDGFSHTWAGDLQATLEDPAGVEHLIFLRPGFLNTSNFGTAGDFTGGSYVFVDDGSGLSLPTSSNGADIPPGTYNQTFDSGGTVWVSGTNGINNTALSAITGPAGTWTLNIYDWGGGDTGNFTGWTLNGNGGSTGTPYCFGDGSGAACPCSVVSAAGEGCTNSSGAGATMSGSGSATIAGDTFQLQIDGVPGNKPGLVLRGVNSIAVVAGDGILCTAGMSMRSQVQVTSAGSTTYTDFNGGPFGSVALLGGASTYFQFWYRDTGNPCTGAGFNFTNGVAVVYVP